MIGLTPHLFLILICGECMKTICIIGAGPSGLFCAHKILKDFHKTGIKEKFQIIMFEQGNEPSGRFCPGTDDGICRKCDCCAILSGGGGAGLFSDGKIIQDLNVGGHNDTIFALSAETKARYISYVTRTLLNYDGVSEYKGKPDTDACNVLYERLAAAGFKAKYYGVLHMGTANLTHILNGFIGELENSKLIHIQYRTRVTGIVSVDNQYMIYSNGKQLCVADYLVMAVGKSGADWLKHILLPLGVLFKKTGYYFGLRVESFQKYLKPLADLSFDPKIYRELADGRKIKMHCFCRKGNVIMTNYNGCVSAGGHSPYTEKNALFAEGEYGNFNILLSYPNKSEEKTIFERFSSMASDRLLVQTLKDFKENREPDPRRTAPYARAAWARPVNIRQAIEDDFFAKEMLGFLSALDSIFPGIGNDDNLLYGPVFEWCMDTVSVSPQMETSQSNLFAVGDGAGLSQGIIYSSATGILAAESIMEKMNRNEA